MGKMKKYTSLLLAFTISISMSLAGCAGKKEEPKNSTVTNSNSAAATTAADPKNMPTLVMTFVGAQVPSDLKLLETELTKLTTAKIGAKVKLLGLTYGNVQDQLTLMLASRSEQLDVMFGPFRNGITSYVSRGQLAPLNNLLKKYGKGITDAIDPAFTPACQLNGETYIVTTNRNLAYQAGWFVRKDIADALKINVDAIKTYEDLTPVLAQIKKAYPQLSTVASSGTKPTLITGPIENMDNMGDYLGVLMDSSKLQISNLFASDLYAKICKLARSWNQAGYIYPDIYTDSSNGGAILIKNGKLASYFSVTKPGAEVENTNSSGQPLVCARISTPVATTGNVQSWAWAIPVNSVDQEKAMQLLNLTYSDPDVINLLCYGVKGTHYEVNSEGFADYVGGKANEGYSIHTQWQYGNPFLAYVWKGDDKNLWKNLDTFNKTAIKSKALGFNFDSSPVSAEFTALSSVTAKYRMILEWGFEDPNTMIPKFNAELKAAGLDKYMAEKQKQLDAWAKANNIK